jgi:hypothetical protein
MASRWQAAGEATPVYDPDDGDPVNDAAAALYGLTGA